MALKNIIGRTDPIKILHQSLSSPDAEFIAVYGRRRIGKTFLIREFFDSDISFEIIGIQGGSLADQLDNFSISLGKAMGIGIQPARPISWKEAFFQLENYLESLKRKKTKVKRVVFFDELPWLNTARSKFLPALQHFWNSYGSLQKDLVLIVCGSAASWMIQNIVRSTGGLHNRITRQIRLLPFTLAETKEFLKSRNITNLNNYLVMQLYMAFGGVPYYLKFVNPGLSAAQVIDSLCFSESGQLRNEYDMLYRSLFEKSEQHMKIVELLSNTRKGLSRTEILEKVGMKSGGAASDVIEELEESGFIESGIPYGKKANESLFRLADEFSLFHLTWIKPLGKRSPGDGYWLTRQSSQKLKVWSGYCFETICQKFVNKLKIKLGIANVETNACPWRYQPPKESESQGVQIDLLIDRKDGVINLCEMKYYDSEFTIDAKYASELRNKIQVFREQSGSRKSIFLTMVTSFGIKKNSYSNDLEVIDIRMDDLF
jgi:uncharacterized protein